MGMVCHTTCLDCGSKAPCVGDFGYIGYPSLSEERGGHEAPNFGHLYQGFAAIHLLSWELDALRAFLEEHAGHRLITFADGEPAFESHEKLVAEEYGEAYEDEEMDEEEEEGFLETDEDLLDEEEAFDDEAAAQYPLAHYELECSQCGASLRSEQYDNLALIEDGAIEERDAQAFLDRVYRNAADAFYRSEILSPDDLEGIATFLKEHKSHGMVAGASLREY